MKIYSVAVLLLSGIILSSCVSEKSENQKPSFVRPFDVLSKANLENDIDYEKHATGEFKIGSSYSQKGRTYSPEVYIDYEEEGLASWYGPRFHGKKTANGSKFNQNEFTAAHATLPLPSVVRVINLENNRSVLVVVNDRGPFHNKGRGKRIIDVSKKAAIELGILHKGVGKVRVEYLHEETKKLLSMYPEEHQRKAVAAYKNALTKQLVEQGTLPNMSKKRL
jgi:rare lipoprotein A (peptidoglycan hydrolase)